MESPRVINEVDMPADLDAIIRQNLCRAHPAGAATFKETRSWHESYPIFSIILEEAGDVIAHVGVVDRTIAVGDGTAGPGRLNILSTRAVTQTLNQLVSYGKTIGDHTFDVMEDDITELRERCEKYKPDLLDVLDIAPAVFYLDGHREMKPVGVSCKRFEAHYKLVIGRSSIRRDIFNSIRERAKKEVAGIIVSPLALADAMLSREEKELGCALVDFGAGVTSVSVYKDGHLLHMSVIPLGGNLITRDITSMQLTKAESEKLKKEYGSAILEKEDDGKMINVEMEGVNREIAVNDLNAIVEARAKEIVENVYARISEVIELKSLGYGIVLAGCASELKKLPELIIEKYKVKARHSAIRGRLVRGGDEMTGNPSYVTAVSIMLKGTEQCVFQPIVAAEPVVTVESPAKEEKEKKGSKEFSRKEKGKGKGWGIFSDIFRED